MFYDLIAKIDILRVFRCVGMVCTGLMFLGIGYSGAYLIEPRDVVGARRLDVIESHWETVRKGSRRIVPLYRVRVVLPNGNPTTFSAKPKQIAQDGNVCAAVAMGRWTQAYHIDIIAPDRCS